MKQRKNKSLQEESIDYNKANKIIKDSFKKSQAAKDVGKKVTKEVDKK